MDRFEQYCRARILTRILTRMFISLVLPVLLWAVMWLVIFWFASVVIAAPAAAADLFAPPASMSFNQAPPVDGLTIHVDVTIISGWGQYDYAGQATIRQGVGPPQQVGAYTGQVRCFLPWSGTFGYVPPPYPAIDFSAFAPTY